VKTILVIADKTFKIDIPDDAKITFGPWSPPPKGREWAAAEKVGTLRIYQGTKENIIACFGGVSSFRDLSMGYAEQVAKEEGATIWKDDEKGYMREHKISVSKQWVNPQLPPKKEKVKNGKRSTI